MISQPIWSIAVDAPIPEPLSYTSSLPLQRGQSVFVPLGKRTAQGVVLGINKKKFEGTIKEILSIDEEKPILNSKYLDWIEWVAEYYLYPIGLVAQLAFPPLSKTVKNRKSQRPPVIPQLESEQKKALTTEQESVFNKISIDHGFNVHLIHGVTGSGKTEVYLQILEKIISKGKQALVLVPEISLTPQLIQRFSKRFGDKIAALHSQLTDRERTNQWWDYVEGRKSILIGARSALFCPTENLGLIILDEEHEPSFKQDEKLRYHGRDCSIVMAKMMDIPVILGSATPSLETWKNAIDGKYTLHQMKKRVSDIKLPIVSVVDMKPPSLDDSSPETLKIKEEKKQVEIPFWLSLELYKKIQSTIERNEQVALFLNRRGMAQMVLCPSCGHTRECPNCDINLTLHGQSHLVCHYCDYHENFKHKCPDCHEGELRSVGIGTEQIESDLQKLFPNKTIARADRDEIQNRLDLENLISKMEDGTIDILVGTQMIAKGLDFPKLKLVGLVLADVGFNLPDFRATERSFQLLVQMSGRAGRHVKADEQPGEVIIQAYNTEHDSIRFALNHDYEGFAANELQIREVLHYPPHGKIIGVKILGPELGLTKSESYRFKKRAQILSEKYPQFSGIEILGPAEAPIAKLRGQFRYHILLKNLNPKLLNSFVQMCLGDQKWISKKIKVQIDIDPMNLL